MTLHIPKSKISSVPDFEVLVASHAKEMRDWREQMDKVAEHAGRDDIPLSEKWMPRPRPLAHPLVDACVNENGEPDYVIDDDGPTPQQILAARKINLLNTVSMAEQAAIARVVPPGKRRLFNLRESEIRRADAEAAKRLTDDHLAAVDRAVADHSKAIERYVADVEEKTKAHAARVMEINKQVAETKPPGFLKKAAVALSLKDPPEPIKFPELAPPPPPPERPDLPGQPDIAAHLRLTRPAEDTRHLEEQQQRRDRIASIERLAAQAHHDVEDLTSETIDGWTLPNFD